MSSSKSWFQISRSWTHHHQSRESWQQKGQARDKLDARLGEYFRVLVLLYMFWVFWICRFVSPWSVEFEYLKWHTFALSRSLWIRRFLRHKGASVVILIGPWVDFVCGTLIYFSARPLLPLLKSKHRKRPGFALGSEFLSRGWVPHVIRFMVSQGNWITST